MSVPKARKPKTHVTLTQKDITRIREEATARALVLATAYLMDEMDYDEDRLIGFWEGVSRYAKAIDTKIISLRTVTRIIEDHTGLTLGAWK